MTRPKVGCGAELKLDHFYNWKNQPERLFYMGKARGWHQFAKVGEEHVWCELLDEDLRYIEETKDGTSNA